MGNDPFISRAQLITLFERNLATDEEIESPVIEIERVGKLIIVSSFYFDFDCFKKYFFVSTY